MFIAQEQANLTLRSEKICSIKTHLWRSQSLFIWQIYKNMAITKVVDNSMESIFYLEYFFIKLGIAKNTSMWIHLTPFRRIAAGTFQGTFKGWFWRWSLTFLCEIFFCKIFWILALDYNIWKYQPIIAQNVEWPTLRVIIASSTNTRVETIKPLILLAPNQLGKWFRESAQ